MTTISIDNRSYEVSDDYYEAMSDLVLRIKVVVDNDEERDILHDQLNVMIEHVKTKPSFSRLHFDTTKKSVLDYVVN